MWSGFQTLQKSPILNNKKLTLHTKTAFNLMKTAQHEPIKAAINGTDDS